MVINLIKTTRKKLTGFTLVEIMIVVLIIGILLAIAVPNFLAARETARAKACVGNLKGIDTAKQQWMMDNKAATFTSYQLAPTAASAGILQTYMEVTPKCPDNGYYTTGNESQLPICYTTASSTIITGTTNSVSTPHELT